MANLQSTRSSATKSDHPYRHLPERSFWTNTVSGKNPEQIVDLYQKKFDISAETAIAAAGSCFAQHISARLRKNGFNYLDAEPRPEHLPRARATEFGYEIYSARYGNIYTARQLLQLAQRALGRRKSLVSTWLPNRWLVDLGHPNVLRGALAPLAHRFVPVEEAWESSGRWYDPLRPTLEPNGFGSLEELSACSERHLRRVRWLLRQSDLFIFTFGLTEAWVSRTDGTVYPICPGTHAGTFDPDKYEFRNFTHGEILDDMNHFIRLVRRTNPNMKFLFTVSPVPLVATASSDHVLVATIYSKSVLRAVAGELCAQHDFVDYFPSYEIINAPAMRGVFFEDDLRSVSARGVDFVMQQFFSAHPVPADAKRVTEDEGGIPDDTVCDEEILEASRA